MHENTLACDVILVARQRLSNVVCSFFSTVYAAIRADTTNTFPGSLLLHLGTAISRTVSLRQAKMPSDSSSLQVTERIVTEGEAFSIQRSRARWYPPPLFEWKTGRMQDKRQTDYVLSQRVQLDSETGIDLLIYSNAARSSVV